LLQASVSDQPASPLLVARGSEQAFGDTLKTFIAHTFLWEQSHPSL